MSRDTSAVAQVLGRHLLLTQYTACCCLCQHVLVIFSSTDVIVANMYTKRSNVFDANCNMQFATGKCPC